MLNNKELKELIVMASKQLSSDAELNIFDDAILNHFKALVIPEVQAVETIKEVIVEKPVEVKVEDTTKINFLDNELQETKKALEDLSLSYMDLLEENTSLKSVNDLLQQQVELLEKQSEKMQNISKLESKLVSNDSVENDSETHETNEVNVPEVASTFKDVKLEEVADDLDCEFEEEKVETKVEEPEPVKQPKRRNTSKSFGVKIPENNNESVLNNRIERSRKTNQTASYGSNVQRKRISSTVNSNSTLAMTYEKNIKNGLINIDNVNLDEFAKYYDIWMEINNGQLPTNMANLYTELVNINKIQLKGDVQ